ncbi:CapA family protein [Sinorhizobium prairiense]|uniref:CapA family protein n=1 Tax=unclassified Sinorhizobium TaxID=2613772 RepID=UPI0023D8A2BA|nr:MULTISPECIES: CapA family protein [unclassified Sinorhizobium]WEJ08603.1 CapA family protein [Sinorhizobium sp. M103]WEJ13896.1 CapA family protein [Sinorhizobium sp. K101]WEJ35495.1 CapA family protein [Sinorhizobium sp. C101]
MIWTLGAVGDVFVNRDNPANAFNGCDQLLGSMDLVFGNCEGAYTDQPRFAPSAGWRVVSAEANGRGLGRAGFDVMALANNHILDAGYEGLSGTIKLLQSQGIATIGAGANKSEATAPAIIDHHGVSVGFLSFACVYCPGYEARGSAPGLSAIRVHSHYYLPEWAYFDPGTVPAVRTFPWPEDVEYMKSLIEDLRKKVDVVIVSHHWGLCVPSYITEYERILGHASVEAGADIILGHHHHFVRGIEIYQGKPIYYGLGHFVFDLPGLELMEPHLDKMKKESEYAIYPREGYPLSPFHPDARMTMVAACDFDGKSLQSAGFYPCLINKENHAIPFRKDDPKAQQVVDYVTRISADAGLKTSYTLSHRLGCAYSAAED